MPYGVFADLIVLAHVAFVLFVLFGAALVAWRPRLAWLHLPAVAWGVLVEVNAWVCPLTPWEQQLRVRAGSGAYGGGFVDHYVVPLLYPRGLTTDVQLVLGIAVLVLNLAAYAWLWHRRRARGQRAAT